MKITETNRYKEILKDIEEVQMNLDFLTTLKNSECGKRIEKFCNNKYGFAYKYFSNPDNFMVVEGRQLYMIDGEIYKASQREIDIYCKATGKTARKVEPKYLMEIG